MSISKTNVLRRYLISAFLFVYIVVNMSGF